MNQEQAQRLIALLEEILAETRATRELLAQMVKGSAAPVVPPPSDWRSRT